MTTASMSSEERSHVLRAAELLRPIARAAAVAKSNGQWLLVFGVLSLLFGLANLDPLGLAIGALVTGTGLYEMRTARRLAAAEPQAPRLLARNELLLMGGIVLYCVFKLTTGAADTRELLAQVGGNETLGLDVAGLMQSVNTLVYATFIAVTLIDAYRTECPDWARELATELRG
jgi:hypothetical protein